MEACKDAIEWAEKYPTLDEAWNACERGDWMGWLLGQLLVGKEGPENRGDLVLAACDCAELVIQHVPDGEDRPRAAIDTARAWARGEATEEEVAAGAAGAAGDAAWAAGAAGDAAWAAWAARDAGAAGAAGAAWDAAWAAWAAWDAARDAGAAGAAARAKTLKKCADIFRQYFPAERVNELLERKGEKA